MWWTFLAWIFLYPPFTEINTFYTVSKRTFIRKFSIIIQMNSSKIQVVNLRWPAILSCVSKCQRICFRHTGVSVEAQRWCSECYWLWCYILQYCTPARRLDVIFERLLIFSAEIANIMYNFWVLMHFLRSKKTPIIEQCLAYKKNEYARLHDLTQNFLLQ